MHILYYQTLLLPRGLLHPTINKRTPRTQDEILLWSNSSNIAYLPLYYTSYMGVLTVTKVLYIVYIVYTQFLKGKKLLYQSCGLLGVLSR